MTEHRQAGTIRPPARCLMPDPAPAGRLCHPYREPRTATIRAHGAEVAAWNGSPSSRGVGAVGTLVTVRAGCGRGGTQGRRAVVPGGARRTLDAIQVVAKADLALRGEVSWLTLRGRCDRRSSDPKGGNEVRAGVRWSGGWRTRPLPDHLPHSFEYLRSSSTSAYGRTRSGRWQCGIA